MAHEMVGAATITNWVLENQASVHIRQNTMNRQPPSKGLLHRKRSHHRNKCNVLEPRIHFCDVISPNKRNPWTEAVDPWCAGEHVH